MAGTQVAFPSFQKSSFKYFRQHFIDRCVWMSDTCRHWIKEVPSISVLSNSHSILNTNHGPYKLSERKEHAQKKTVVTVVFWWLILEHTFIEDW